MNRYQLEDIISVDIPESVWRDAQKMADFLASKAETSAKHIGLKENRDVIGLLGHWAVDAILTRWGIPFTSTRKEKYRGGDDYDVEVEGNWLDVKSTSYGQFSEKYFYNMNFYLICKKMDDPKAEDINAFVLVHIELDSNRKPKTARIMGTINLEEIKASPIIGPQEKPFKLIYANYHLKSRQLKSLYNYIYKT